MVSGSNWPAGAPDELVIDGLYVL